jgi:hypothetical protein
MLGSKDRPYPVRKIIQSRKRSRIFGIQPVGFLHRPMSPRVGIFAWVIPAKLSPWTFDEGLRPTCRIWSWMTTGVPALTLRSGNRSGVFRTVITHVDGFASRRALKARRASPSPRNHVKVSSGVTARHSLSIVIPFSLEVASNRNFRASKKV